MKTGKEMKAMMEELELTPARVAAEADVSIATLYNVFADKPSVGPNVRNRIRKTFTQFKQKSKTG